ncbi:cytidine deaminase [Jiangella asiatica]|uniref:Cytidine deaminase n=1 Tax=Jiangella asiatica TaxID=2530372 RepID=A0A4R5CPS4_9ACTN|nr:cytidine deaminase [Jiangella asiatica]TDE01310.1 cytidine deaminase [Jiangella asiatica]
MSDALDPEDAKILTLARSARARAGAPGGAAVRDLDGRTYAAADVGLPSLRLTALQVAVASAVSSGATGLEAAAVVTEAVADPVDVAAAADLGGPGVPVFVAGPDGTPITTLRT